MWNKNFIVFRSTKDLQKNGSRKTDFFENDEQTSKNLQSNVSQVKAHTPRFSYFQHFKLMCMLFLMWTLSKDISRRVLVSKLMKLSSFYVTCNIHLIKFLESSVNNTAINQTLSYDKLSSDKTSSSLKVSLLLCLIQCHPFTMLYLTFSFWWENEGRCWFLACHCCLGW